MTAEHFDEALLALVGRKPFQIFTVVLHGGDRFEVDYPNAVTFREGIAVFLGPGGRPHIFDHDSVLQFIAADSSTLGRPQEPGSPFEQ